MNHVRLLIWYQIIDWPDSPGRTTFVFSIVFDINKNGVSFCRRYWVDCRLVSNKIIARQASVQRGRIGIGQLNLWKASSSGGYPQTPTWVVFSVHSRSLWCSPTDMPQGLCSTPDPLTCPGGFFVPLGEVGRGGKIVIPPDDLLVTRAKHFGWHGVMS